MQSVHSGLWALRNRMNISIGRINEQPVGEKYTGHNFHKLLSGNRQYALHPEDTVRVEIENPEGRWIMGKVHSIYLLPHGYATPENINNLVRDSRQDMRKTSFGFQEWMTGKRIEDGERFTFSVSLPDDR